jgi:hypothetical protein
MHQNCKRSIEAEYNRIVAEKVDRGGGWKLVRDLRTKEIALKAIELLNLEKVENLWRKACALRWRCCHEKVLPASWMTEREIDECRFVKDHNEGPLSRPWMIAMKEQTRDQLKRRHSLS